MATRPVLLVCAFIFVVALNLRSQSNLSLLNESLIRENQIKGVTEWNHPVRGDEPAEKGAKSLNARYDSKGHQVEEVSYNSKGEETRKVTSRYDNYGNRTEYVIYDSRSGRVTFSRMTGYDDHGNRIAEWGFDGLGDYRNTYHLDNEGRTSEIHYTSGGNLKEKRLFSYKGNITEISVVLPDNTVNEIIRLEKNVSGELVAEAYHDNQGNLVRKVEYSWENGLKTGERHYQGDQMMFRNNFVYEEGLLDRIIKVDRQGRETVTNQYSYDDRSRLIRESWYNETSGNYSFREYSYDNHGNMLSVNSYYATYQFQVLYRYDYCFF
ncbi:MAG: hypothetical protein EA408_04715 [Marinilabiliales bacterium]|nr:MAG: hypothetical protein EA408_04715 [Marinilabiliales bacterium]